MALAGLMKMYNEKNSTATSTSTSTTSTTTTPTNTDSASTTTTTTTNEGVTVERQNSKTMANSRRQKSKDGGVFSLGGKRTKTRENESCILRVMNDLQNHDAESTPGVELIVDEANLRHFKVTVTPQEGMWMKAKFNFQINIPSDYPFSPPEVTCQTLVYHPNIDLKGRVCLNILRFEWSAALGLGHVLFGLMTLFLEPNPDDPLNTQAADLMVNSPDQFKKNVYDSLRGKYVAGHQFDKLL